MTVFCFKCRFEGDDLLDTQTRYVLARSEQQAISKMEEYCKGLEERGFAKLLYIPEPTVEIQNVIV